MIRIIASLALFTFCAVPFAAQTPIPDAQKQTETRKTVHELFVEDQETIPGAANGMSTLTPQQYIERLEVRKATLRAMLADGEIKSAMDFKEAAFIFQHGDNPEDCLFAHVLAMEALARGEASAKWIAAATLDRYLQSIKQPQIFGTQYPLDPNLPHPVAGGNAPFRGGLTLQPYNEDFLTDAVRLDFCVPVLAQQKQNVSLFNAGQRPRGTMTAPGCSR
jgi:hypothetical protein